mmetsp:Transcript_40672/g.112963  ORF Transcript_40672/g.112963 Transcript_40672/m.112963 type:complete len:332 (-) Transcript_40672:96-1091(-)
MPPSMVVVHPLVLLNVVDHYNRVAKDTKNRVVGVLLGETFKGKLDITNSFAVPFEEDAKDPETWFLDHQYLDKMFSMFEKVSAREKIVGFYSTGPKIRAADIRIDEGFRKLHPTPALVIVDVRPDVDSMPTKAYISQETVAEGGSETHRVFQHVPCEVGAYEAEEVGVEHLLRDINDPSVTVLAEEVRHKLGALRVLAERLREMGTYLGNVLEGRLPPNNAILYNMQTILNLLPNLTVDKLVRSMLVKSNDMHLILYISSVIRAVLALHDLVNNKFRFRDMYDDDKADKKEVEEADKADKEAKAEGGAGSGAKKDGEEESKAKEKDSKPSR